MGAGLRAQGNRFSKFHFFERALISRVSIPDIVLHSFSTSSKVAFSIYSISNAIIAWVNTSADEPLAM